MLPGRSCVPRGLRARLGRRVAAAPKLPKRLSAGVVVPPAVLLFRCSSVPLALMLGTGDPPFSSPATEGVGVNLCWVAFLRLMPISKKEQSSSVAAFISSSLNDHPNCPFEAFLSRISKIAWVAAVLKMLPMWRFSPPVLMWVPCQCPTPGVGSSMVDFALVTLL